MRWLYEQSRPARPAMILSAALGWLAGLAVIAQAFCLSRIIHAVFIDTRLREELTTEFAALAAAILLRAGLAWLREAGAFAAGEKVRSHVRLQLLDHITAQGPAFTRTHRTGDLTSVLVEQVEGLHDFYALYLPQLALVALLPLTVTMAVFPLSWAAAGLLIATAPLIPLFTILVGMGAENISQRHFQALARMSAHFLEVLQGLSTLKLFGCSRAEADRIAKVSSDYRQRTMSVLRVAFLSSAVLEFFASLSLALIAVYLGMSHLGYFNFGMYGRSLTLADSLFILLLAPEFFLPLRELGAHYHARAQALAAAERIRDLLGKPLPGLSAGTLRPKASEGIHLRCRSLHAAYEGGRRPALKGVSLDLSPDCCTALIGSSGAGKSTLIHLLMGFLRPDQGEILVNEVRLDRIDQRWWRSQVGWIGQNPVLFHGTIRDNLRLGRPTADEADILTAAKAAGVLSFAERLPRGLDTPVGEQGVGLSRGEAQRVALGRVILKDAPVLLLDEPCAGLDAETERLVISGIEALKVGRTILIVTHRLADLQRSDRVVVLEEGRIAEAGHPSDLISGLVVAGAPLQRPAEGGIP
jgi:ATP-binding cassette subfamily C protein CydD